MFGWRQSKPFAKRRKFNPKPKSVAQKVTRLQRQVALLKPEVKYFQGIFNTANITQAAGLIVFLSGMTQGSADNNRIGDSIRPKSIRCRGLFADSAAVTQLRMLLVKDNDSNGLTPVISGATTAILTTFVPRSAFLTNQNKKRFTIMYDRYMTLTSITNGYSAHPAFDTGVIKLSGLTTYINSGGTGADAGKNQYYWVVLTDGADTLDLNGGWELGFTDV